MTNVSYRKRIYANYVSDRQNPLVLESINELAPRAPMLQKIIREHFPDHKDAVIIDLGCGCGAFVWLMREAGYTNVSGVDSSPEQVATAERLGIGGIRAGDLMETLKATGDASHDVVISFDIIEHFTKAESVDFVDEVYRILKPSGRWIIHAPNGESPFFGRVRYGDFTHEQALTRESIFQLLKSSGFATVVCQEDMPVPHGMKSFFRWVLWKCIRAVLRFYLAVETGSGESACIFSQNFLTIASK